MNRVYQVVEYGEKIPVQFSSKAESVEGVFRAFQKKHSKLLKEGTIYVLYLNVAFGFQKIGAAYWNCKAFVKVAISVSLNNPFEILSDGSFVENI